jgi:hypothetical protein
VSELIAPISTFAMMTIERSSRAYASWLKLSSLMIILQLLGSVSGLPTQFPPSSTTVSSSSTSTSFPVIWIASAIVQCGAPLMRDICSTSFNNSVFPVSRASIDEDIRSSQSAYSHIITETVITTTLEQYVTMTTCDDGPMTSLQFISTVTSTQLSTIYSAQSFAVTSSSPYATTSFSTTHVFVSASRISEERSYEPSLLYTTGPPSPGGIPGEGLLPRHDTLLDNSTSIGRYDINLVRRTVYDYDPCSNEPPSHDLATNSLTDVCHFVANAQDYFVTLQPISSAAYLPSWLSYVIQTIEAGVEIWAVVSTRHLLSF